jgi:DNA polymerase-3 subunit delta'
MSGFKDVIGHKDIIEYITNITKEKKLSHAYILNGEKGSGKTLLADIFSLAIQCDQAEGAEGPCKTCSSCKQGVNKNQPDIIRVTHEKPNAISVDDIRVQVNNTIDIRPYSSPYKIYIIEQADLLTVQAQNALLKNIEEPPPYAIFILLTRNADILLETIQSRCVILRLRNIKNSLVRKYLIERLNIPEDRVDLSVAFAAGNIGRAVLLAESENFNQIREEVIRLLTSIREMELEEIPAVIKSVEKLEKTANTDEVRFTKIDVLDLLAVWYRDVLMYKATKNVDMVVFKDRIGSIKEQVTTSSYEGIEEILKGIENAKARINANVNFELAMELLLLTMMEN